MNRWSLSLIKPWGMTRPDATTPVDDDQVSHIACACSPNVNLCGLRQEFHGFTDGPLPSNACVVCVDLDDLPCERCGQ